MCRFIFVPVYVYVTLLSLFFVFRFYYLLLFWSYLPTKFYRHLSICIVKNIKWPKPITFTYYYSVSFNHISVSIFILFLFTAMRMCAVSGFSGFIIFWPWAIVVASCFSCLLISMSFRCLQMNSSILMYLSKCSITTVPLSICSMVLNVIRQFNTLLMKFHDALPIIELLFLWGLILKFPIIKTVVNRTCVYSLMCVTHW